MRHFLTIICSIFLFNISWASTNLKEGSLLQDDELEETSQMIMQDLFKAGKVHHTPTIYFLVSRDINAAATSRGTLIIFTAFILACKNVHEFIGVMAHETAHIKGAHSALRDIHAKNASIPGILAIALSGIAALATGNGEIFAAGAMGGMGMMERGILKYNRDQEDMADAGALSILKELSWTAEGLMTFLKTIDQKYSIHGMDPYLLTHPLTPERISKIQAYLKNQDQVDKTPSLYKKCFERMRGKIYGFTQEPQATLRHYAGQKSTEACYARAIAFYRMRKMNQFKSEIDTLLSQAPNDTYFLELKGQVEFELGNHKGALPYFEKAKRGRNKISFGLDVMTSHAIIESKGDYKKAINLLTPHLDRDPSQAFAWRLLGIAYGKLGKEADASGCLAEAAYLMEDFKAAKLHAKRAQNAQKNSIRLRAKELLKYLEKTT